MTSTDESNLITAGMAATTCSPKPNAGQMTGPAACAVRVRSALIPATLSARCGKAMIAGSPVAAASRGSPNGLDRRALASAGQGTSWSGSPAAAARSRGAHAPRFKPVSRRTLWLRVIHRNVS